MNVFEECGVVLAKRCPHSRGAAAVDECLAISDVNFPLTFKRLAAAAAAAAAAAK